MARRRHLAVVAARVIFDRRTRQRGTECVLGGFRVRRIEIAVALTRAVESVVGAVRAQGAAAGVSRSDARLFSI